MVGSGLPRAKSFPDVHESVTLNIAPRAGCIGPGMALCFRIEFDSGSLAREFVWDAECVAASSQDALDKYLFGTENTTGRPNMGATRCMNFPFRHYPVNETFRYQNGGDEGKT